MFATIEPATGRLTLTSATQAPHHIRKQVTEQLGMPESALRVISPDVGGGFGYKGKLYPEESLVVWAARRLSRPVRWVATRAESFLADNQARDHFTHAELALDSDGRFLALKVETSAALGAYLSTFGANIPSAIYTALFAGGYRTPAIFVEVTGVFTNTTQTDAYRGAGRPEACYVLERLADRAAAKLGLDRAEIRRRNFIPPAAMPYKTPIGPTYDCGDFPKIFARVLELADYAHFEKRRKEAARRGKLRGIGMACYVESSGVAPSRFAGMLGRARRLLRGGIAPCRTGWRNTSRARHPQSRPGPCHHLCADHRVAARRADVASIEIVEGDTDEVPHGTGTFGSRSIAVGGSALDRAAEKIVAKGRLIAAHLLEAAAGRHRFRRRHVHRRRHRSAHFICGRRAGRLCRPQPPARAGAGPAGHRRLRSAEFRLQQRRPRLRARDRSATPAGSISSATGRVDDVGTVINPMIVEGQIHGGIAQGLGQALLEHCAYDDGGQLVAGSFMDYAIARADDLPDFVTECDESQPCTHNPLGAKGCGEAGSIGSPAAIVSAALDALGELGVTDLEMPLTPERVWRRIRRTERA